MKPYPKQCARPVLLTCTHLMQVLVELGHGARRGTFPLSSYEARPVVRRLVLRPQRSAMCKQSSCLQALGRGHMASKQHVPKFWPPTL